MSEELKYWGLEYTCPECKKTFTVLATTPTDKTLEEELKKEKTNKIRCIGDMKEEGCGKMVALKDYKVWKLKSVAMEVPEDVNLFETDEKG